MKWNGIVSQLAQRTIAARFARAKTAQATSTRLRSNHSVTGMSDRLDGRARAELLPETPHAGAEAEAAQLRRQVGARRDDQDGQLGMIPIQLLEDGQAVDTGKQEVEQDEVVDGCAGSPQRVRAVVRDVHGEAFGFQPPREEAED